MSARYRHRATGKVYVNVTPHPRDVAWVIVESAEGAKWPVRRVHVELLPEEYTQRDMVRDALLRDPPSLAEALVGLLVTLGTDRAYDDDSVAAALTNHLEPYLTALGLPWPGLDRVEPVRFWEGVRDGAMP